MAWITDWEAFLSEARSMYARSEGKVRYVVKYRQKSAAAILKVTDDVKCLKYQIVEQADISRLNTFAQVFMQWTFSDPKGNVEDLPLKLQNAMEQREKLPKSKKKKVV